MINYLKIDHFKAFLGTVEMAIDDKNVLIFGENGSGKSSIYQALKLIFHKQKIFDSKIPKTITDPNERKRHENDILASYNHQQSPLTGFTIEINNTTYDTFSTAGYDVSMISQEDIQVEDKINVVDLFGKAMVGIVNPTDFINNKKDTIVSLVNSFLKDYFFEGNLSVELVYDNPSWFLQVTDISRGNLTRNEELTAFFNEAKLHIIKLLLLLTAIQFNGAKERRESLILVLDDVITSMDAANRTLFIRLLKDFFEDYQLIVLTHSISFFNLTNYSFSIAYQQKDKWKLFQIIEHEGNSEVIDREPQDFASLINKDFKAGQSLGIVGNRIRKRFEFLVSEVASVLYTGGIVESTHLLKTITDKKKIYCEYVGAKKKPHTVYELVDELTAIIDTAPPSPLKSQLDSIIARYTSGTEIAKLKDVLSDLSIYQKVSMHPLSHATGALSLSTQAEVDRSITLLQLLEKQLEKITDKDLYSI